MNYSDADKQLLLSNAAATLCNINLLDSDGSIIATFSEDDYVVETKLEDFRFVPDTGFIGQFVERLLDGKLSNIPLNIDLNDKEISFEIGVKANNSQNINYYNYGNFIITEIKTTDTTGQYTFKATDYTKKFNKEFNGEREYPCLALNLLNDAASQAGVSIDGDYRAFGYAVGAEGLPAGDYYFQGLVEGDVTYYNFTTEVNLSAGDSLLYSGKTDKVIQKVLDNEFVPTRTNLNVTSSTSTHTGTLLSSEMLTYVDIVNNDFVINNNQFVENNSCRDVVKAIAQLGYTWARVNEHNDLCLDFTKKATSDVDTYNIINTDRYFSSSVTGETVAPVNKILIGMSSVDGENVYKTDTGYTEENESAIYIYDNPLTYNENLRRMAIQDCGVLFGLTYTPMEIDSIAHPWVNGDDYVKVDNVNNQTFYTYPFNRTINYKGVINTKLASQSKSNTNQKYEWKDSIINKLRKTSIEVDKANGNITLLTQTTQDIQTDLSENYYTKETINTLIQNAETGVTNTFSEAGGNNIFHNTGLWFLNEDEDHDTSPYEYWTGLVVRGNNELSSNRHSFLLQQGTLTQNQNVPNGNYTVSFKYKKLLPLSEVKCIINGIEYDLNETGSFKEFIENPIVTSQNISVSFTSTMNNACEIYDLMVNAGSVKLAYSQNQNETITDTVNISKGITINSTAENATFKANADGIRIVDERGTIKTKFTEDGTETDELIVHNKAQIVGLLRQKVGDQIWDTMI